MVFGKVGSYSKKDHIMGNKRLSQ